MPDNNGAHYDEMHLHRIMLQDAVRVNAFSEALKLAVKPGDTVLDVGAGTGILGFLALKAGAGRVIAVEPTGVSETARELAELNGWGDRYRVIASPIEEVKPEEQVDLIVFEWMGALGNDENMYPIFLKARDAWLKPGGALIPARVEVFLSPASDSEVHKDRAFWLNRPYGVDMKPIWSSFRDEFRYASHYLNEDDLLAEPKSMWVLDALTDTAEKAAGEFRAELRFQATRDGVADGLAGWFDAVLFGDVRLTNAPAAPHTHWGRLVIPLEREYRIRKGDTMEVRFTETPGGPGWCRGGYSFRHNGGEWEHHLDHRKG